MGQQIAVILRRIAGRNRRAGARVQEVVADLRRVEGARVDYPVQRGGLADGGDAEEPDLALRAQPLERRHDLVEHALGGEIAALVVPTIALWNWNRSTRSRCSRVRLASSEAAIAAPILPRSVGGSRTLVPT